VHGGHSRWVLLILVDLLVDTPAYFEREAAAAGIAFINCLGALGGVFASNLLGTIKASQGRLDLGLYIVAGIAAAGAISLYLAFPKPRISAASLLKVA
jgi:hypothetical protein